MYFIKSIYFLKLFSNFVLKVIRALLGESRRYIFFMGFSLSDIGQKRIERRFLIFPMKINNKWKWFEEAVWEEEFIRIDHKPYFKWKKLKWIKNRF